ncbi:GNAT family N-acetyltransferase [Oleispirillum naphthae]|uniref:GNAT family N-acetyltransferase n=1 Tax=Oleispirillum naphthae TaxID=2838853 RepID=UPI0030822355
MTEPAPRFRAARPADAPAIARMVNAAYRGASGWTGEGHLLSGRRTDAAAVLEMMRAAESLLLLCCLGDALAGCAYLHRESATEVYFGMLAVDPALQAGGLGKALMAEVEARARETWGATALLISVVNKRPELIAYYVRRGYVPTGETRPFPFADGLSAALVDGIELAMLRKAL